MLRELTWEQLLEWMAFDRISPIGDRRGDWQAATVCAAVINSSAALKGLPPIVRVADMMLEFSDAETPAPAAAKQPAGKNESEMKFIARMSTALANADEARSKRKRR